MRLVRLGTVTLLLAIGTLAACGDDEDPGYTVERRDAFLGACEQGADAAVCRCTWDRMVTRVPAERFVAVSEELAEGARLPDDLAALAEECATAAVLGD